MDRRDKALRFIDISGRGLEIGPSYDPLVTKASGVRIETVDHADRDTLVAKYRAWGLPPDKIASIEAVDHVWSGGSLLDTIPDHDAYDYVVASHFVEHTVDLIRFLLDCEALLNRTGRLALVVPDKRYCFDRFQPLSTVGDAVDAFYATNIYHTAGALLDHQAYACKRGDSIAWSVHESTPYTAQFPALEGAMDVIKTGVSQETYSDIHKWKFTPSSFALLIRDLRALGYHNLGEVGSNGTDGFEFFVTLAKDVEPVPIDRIEALLQIETELAEPRDAVGQIEDHRDKPRSMMRLQRRAVQLRRKVAVVRASRLWRATARLRAAGYALRHRGAR
jgi:hypothetical protein